MKCQICESSCSGTIQISDWTYVLRENSPVCKTCFDLWVAGKEDELLRRIKKKLIGKKQEEENGKS